MAVIEGGASGSLLNVDAATLAGRMQIRPTDVGSLGSYVTTGSSGTIAAGLAGGSTVFSCRWGDATRAMLLQRVGIQAKNLTTAFTAGATLMDMVFARSFTGSDTGQTTLTPSANEAKRRTSFGTSLITDLRIINTAAITVGTRTLDARALSLARGHVPATSINYPFFSKSGVNVPGATTVAYGMEWLDLFSIDTSREWPLVFVQNEGFILRATVPATGTWTLDVLMEWSEVVTTAGYN